MCVQGTIRICNCLVDCREVNNYKSDAHDNLKKKEEVCDETGVSSMVLDIGVFNVRGRPDNIEKMKGSMD